MQGGWSGGGAGGGQPPGFELLTCPGGDTLPGRRWVGVDVASGRRVLLRQLPAELDLVAREAARREVAQVAAVRHEHLLPLRPLLTPPGAVVLVYDGVDGIALEQLLRARPRLTPGQVVTLGAPLAAALAALHAAGHTHGAVCASSVWVSRDGRPLLADAGVRPLARLLAGRAADGPEDGCDRGEAEDVRALAALCREALAGAPPDPTPDPFPQALVAALEAAMADPPGRRPPAAALATALLLGCPASPLRPTTQHAVGAASAPPRARARPTGARPTGARRPRLVGGRGRPGRPRVAGALTSLGLAILVWQAAAGSDVPGEDELPAVVPTPTLAAPPGATTGATPEPAEAPSSAPAPDWRAVVQGLDDARARAFVQGDARPLEAVYAPGSPALAHDLALLHALQGSRSRASGLRFEVLEARRTSGRADRVELQVVDRLLPYHVLDGRGRVREAREGRGVQHWDLTLQRIGGEWRVLEVTRRRDGASEPGGQPATTARAAESRSGRVKG